MNRRTRLAIFGLLAALGATMVVISGLPEGLKAVGDVAASPAKFDGKYVTLKGSVEPGSLVVTSTLVRFTLTDGGQSVEIEWAKGLPQHYADDPNETIEGRTVLIKGTVEARGATAVLIGDEMQVGCASKYEGQP